MDMQSMIVPAASLLFRNRKPKKPTCSSTSLGVSNMQRSRRFYGTMAGEDNGTAFTGYGKGDDNAFFISEESYPVGYAVGSHIAWEAPNRAAVDEFHRQALANGGQDNGAPGIREHYSASYYAAFVKDPDGHHLEAVCFKQP